MGGTAEATSTSKRAWAILWAMGFGALIAQMFSTVIGPALPTIKDDLGLSLSAQTWTITAYSLAFGTALIAGGRMGDLVGEVRMIVIGFLIFGVGLVMSAVALGGGLLIAGRTVQGIGIGLSAPATLSIVVNSFPVSRRGFAVGIWGFAHGFGLLIGPLFAGYMLELLSWRWVFWIAVPLTAAVIIVTLGATRGYTSVLASGRYDVIVAGSACQHLGLKKFIAVEHVVDQVDAGFFLEFAQSGGLCRLACFHSALRQLPIPGGSEKTLSPKQPIRD